MTYNVASEVTNAIYKSLLMTPERAQIGISKM